MLLALSSVTPEFCSSGPPPPSLDPSRAKRLLDGLGLLRGNREENRDRALSVVSAIDVLPSVDGSAGVASVVLSFDGNGVVFVLDRLLKRRLEVGLMLDP